VPTSEELTIPQLVLEIFGGCDFKCPMCPQAKGREKAFLKKIPFGVFCKIIDEAMDYGLEVVSVHGSGEATLDPDMPQYVESSRATD
jgi:MoaA/NifB/PqqE/SkfB family radical SAM enzyme